MEHQRRLGQDERFEPGLSQIFDFEDVTDVEVTPAGIQMLAQRRSCGCLKR